MFVLYTTLFPIARSIFHTFYYLWTCGMGGKEVLDKLLIDVSNSYNAMERPLG